MVFPGLKMIFDHFGNGFPGSENGFRSFIIEKNDTE